MNTCDLPLDTLSTVVLRTYPHAVVEIYEDKAAHDFLEHLGGDGSSSEYDTILVFDNPTFPVVFMVAAKDGCVVATGEFPRALIKGQKS